MKFKPKDPEFAAKVRESFARQTVMNLIGAELTRVEAGKVDIKLPFREDLSQQDDFIHAGIITTIADSACGYAAFTLMPAGSKVLSVEFKVNLLAPARGAYFLAEGRIVKAGKTLSVARADVFAFIDDDQKIIAAMQATIICLAN